MEQLAQLWVFNPGHEEALAYAHTINYTPRREVTQMMVDLAPLVSLLGNRGDYYWCHREHCPKPIDLDTLSKSSLQQNYPQQLILRLWANEPHIQRKIQKHCAEIGIELISPILTQEYYQLAHRRATLGLLTYLIQTLQYPWYLQPQWIEFTPEKEVLRRRIEQAVQTLEQTGYPISSLFLKRPYSSSGRGVMPLPYPLTQEQRFIVERSCHKAHSVSIEVGLSVVEDWALEFWIGDDGGERITQFIGFSHFQTGAGGKAYSGNILRSQSKLRSELETLVGVEPLERLIQTTQTYITTHIAPYYQGYLGIDLFLYREGDTLCLHPAVEINLRCTMGIIALFAFEYYCADTAEGLYRLVYHQDVEKLYREHRSLYPPQYDDEGRLIGGVLPLTQPPKGAEFYVFLDIRREPE